MPHNVSSGISWVSTSRREMPLDLPLPAMPEIAARGDREGLSATVVVEDAPTTSPSANTGDAHEGVDKAVEVTPMEGGWTCCEGSALAPSEATEVLVSHTTQGKRQLLIKRIEEVP